MKTKTIQNTPDCSVGLFKPKMNLFKEASCSQAFMPTSLHAIELTVQVYFQQPIPLWQVSRSGV